MAVINGIRAIALYIGVSEVTVNKYIKEYGLPIRKLYNGPSAPVMSTSNMLDQWVEEMLYDPKTERG